jgi:hypothetical protein
MHFRGAPTYATLILLIPNHEIYLLFDQFEIERFNAIAGRGGTVQEKNTIYGI